MDTEANKMMDIVRKNADPKLVEKYDDLQKELKKHLGTAKDLFEDKIGEKVELNKITEKVLKTTKDMEVSLHVIQIICNNHNHNLLPNTL